MKTVVCLMLVLSSVVAWSKSDEAVYKTDKAYSFGHGSRIHGEPGERAQVKIKKMKAGETWIETLAFHTYDDLLVLMEFTGHKKGARFSQGYYHTSGGIHGWVEINPMTHKYDLKNRTLSTTVVLGKQEYIFENMIVSDYKSDAKIDKVVQISRE